MLLLIGCLCVPIVAFDDCLTGEDEYKVQVYNRHKDAVKVIRMFSDHSKHRIIRW